MEAHKAGGTFGPITDYLEIASNILDSHKSIPKVWQASQYRSIALAIVLLQRKQVIALPTDTLYGLACLANDSDCIQKLYNIKGRDTSKPFAICVGKLEDIPKYGVVTEDVNTIINSLLPGPFTIILNRTKLLNKDLNPDHDTIGIRVPNYWFTRCVVETAGPIALTSANKSGKKNCIDINEFADLWSELGGVFSDPYTTKSRQSRQGSTIIDLSIPGKYSIVRGGVGYNYAMKVLSRAGFTRHKVTEKVGEPVPSVLSS